MRNFDEIGVNIKRGIKGEKIKMRDKGIWEILAIFMVLVIIGSCVAVPSAGDASESEVKSSSSATIYVPDGYPTIQAAVNAASPGDTIIVKDGTYKENVLLNKRLTLIGDALPTIDAQGKGDAINITAEFCVVTGFRCVNARGSAGIIVDSDWNRVENNTCEKNNYGICLNDSSNNSISNNSVINNKYGISLYYPPSSGIVKVRVNAPEYVEEGATFVATIGVNSIEDFYAGIFDLSFDHSVVKVIDVEDGCIDRDTIPVMMWAPMERDTIRMFLCLPGDTTVSGSGYLAKISFKVKGKEGDKSVLNLSNGFLEGINFADSVPMPEEIPAVWIDAKIRVGSKEEEGEKKEEKEEKVEVQVGSHNNFISKNTISNNGYGIYLVSSSSNTLMNNIVSSNNRDGFYLKDSSNNTIKNNEVCENNDDGIYLKRSTNNEIKNNEIHENNDNGVHAHDSSNSMVASNKIYDNKDGGIYLRNSGNSTLTNNTMSGSDHNFAVYGEHLSDYIQNIDTSNKVDGKPVYYLVNKQDRQIPSDAGYVGVVNSTNITVRDLTLTNNGQGVLIVFSKDSKIENVNASDNKYGIYLDHSSNNVLMNNNASNNHGDGIYLEYSTNNEITENKIHENRDNGICVHDSSNNNTMQNNEVRKNNDDDGIYLKRSTNNEIKNNKILENRDNGIHVYDSSNNNTIQNNEVRKNNDDGFCLKRSTNNEIKNNKIHDNNDNGIYAHDSSNNMITSNEIYDNKDNGIYLRNSGNSTLTNNTILGNEHNFAVYGEHLFDYIQNIDTSNKVDGKPVYYLVNKQDQQIPGDTGYVGIVNSTNITVKDLALTNNGQGVLIAFSKDSRIENVNASNNKYGIYLDSSSNNVLMNNKVSNNDDDGIYLEDSANNTIKNNGLYENKDNGICIYDSSNNNTIQDNEVRGNNDDGIYLKRSTNNEITNNKIHENRGNGIYVHDSSNNNTIQDNEVRGNNDDGIYLKRSHACSDKRLTF